MADVTERMLALLSTLQTGRSFSGEELTRRLSVSPRTLRRDVDRLRGYGYPVETQPGPGGYYRLAAGRTMPPLVLDDDEAVATLLALASLAAIGPSTEGGIDDAATRAYGKLDQFLPARLRPRVASIRASLETSPQRAPSVTAHQFSIVAEAIAAPGDDLVHLHRTPAANEPIGGWSHIGKFTTSCAGTCWPGTSNVKTGACSASTDSPTRYEPATAT